MITSTHDQLDTWVTGLTLITGLWGIYSASKGYINRGWKEAAVLEKKITDDAIAALKAGQHVQFSRIDELKMAISVCVTRDMHDDFQREVTARIDQFATNLSRQIMEGFRQVNSRIDHLSDKKHD